MFLIYYLFFQIRSEEEESYLLLIPIQRKILKFHKFWKIIVVLVLVLLGCGKFNDVIVSLKAILAQIYLFML